MMKYIAILFGAFCLVQSQRPPYAGNRNRYPQVLPQYLDELAAEQAATASIANKVNVVNRVNGDDNNSTPLTTSTTTTTMIPPDLPVDALGDVDLVNRIKTWPKEKQPFWFLNWQQIQEQRGDKRHRALSTHTLTNIPSYITR